MNTIMDGKDSDTTFVQKPTWSSNWGHHEGKLYLELWEGKAVIDVRKGSHWQYNFISEQLNSAVGEIE